MALKLTRRIFWYSNLEDRKSGAKEHTTLCVRQDVLRSVRRDSKVVKKLI